MLPRDNINSILLFTTLCKSGALFARGTILSNQDHYNLADPLHCIPILFLATAFFKRS